MITSAHKGLAVEAERCRKRANAIDTLVAALEKIENLSRGVDRKIDLPFLMEEINSRSIAALALARGEG